MSDGFATFLSSINALASYTLFTLGTTAITPRKLIVALFALWFSHFLSHWIEKLIHRTLMRKDFDPGVKGSIERFTRYGIFTLGIVITLAYIGFNIPTCRNTSIFI